MDDLNIKIERLTTQHLEASSKLDHFILGVTLAICAYLGQTNPYAQLGLNKETFLLLSLLVFAASAVCGFKRLEGVVRTLRANTVALKEEVPLRRDLTLLAAQEIANRADRYYHARNYLLLAGLFCYLTTKVWDTYQSHGWISVH
ncbi:hypothetical protein ACIGJK_24360 [Pseudomonas iridis]|uniref:hypothetical protein n=1 Tax=Pseudomonas iridis TaxID=2710587 RepID=UPI0037CA1C64